jgi:hypothetical protein
MKLKSEGPACGSPSLLSFIRTIQFSHASEVSKLFDITLQTYGSIDILVNNAGIMMTTSVSGSMFPHSFNRLGETKDITSTVLFLASKEAQCVTYGTVHIIYYVIF